MPKAEEVYELLEIYLDKDKNQFWGHLGRRRSNTIVEVVCAQKVESEDRFEYNMTIYGFYETYVLSLLLGSSGCSLYYSLVAGKVNSG